MSSFVLIFYFALGFCIGGVGGIVVGFVWYERKCGLFSDHTGQRARAIRYELDDIIGHYVRRSPKGRSERVASLRHSRR
jgi:hypothetical protein